MTARDLYGGSDVVRTKKKKSPAEIRRKAVRDADKWASLDVRLDASCVLIETPGHVCKGSIECGHLFSRIAYSTRWDEANLYCLCTKANMDMENDPVVARQLLDYAEYLWGPDIIAQLHMSYEKAVPMKTFEIQEASEIWHSKYIKHCQWRENGNE